DPGMRGFMDEGEDDARGQKFDLNKPITSRTVAQVIKSNHDNFPAGTIIHGRLAWQKYQSIAPENLEKVDPDIAPISTAVSILGVTGLAAYFGMLRIGKPQDEETSCRFRCSRRGGQCGCTDSNPARMQGDRYCRFR